MHENTALKKLSGTGQNIVCSHSAATRGFLHVSLSTDNTPDSPLPVWSITHPRKITF
jgi:hypothetical protein